MKTLALPLLALGCGFSASASDAGLPDFYDPDVVQAIELEIAPADRDRMDAALPDEIFVPATFRWNDVVVEQVGVRYKGNSSRMGTWKKGFLLKFDEFVPDQEFQGLRRVALDNGIQFGSLFSERLLDEILAREGVPASRVNYARLTIDGESLGVYVNVERIDKHFLARHFADDEGNLYKCDEGGAGARLEWLGDDPAGYVGFEAQTNEDTADRSDLVAWIDALATTPAADVGAMLEDTFELDAFLRLMPVMVFGGAFDQYTGFNTHNYYLYRDPTTSRWAYLVHDLDVGFADHAFGTIEVIDGWDAAAPLPVTPLALVERILDDPALAETYRAHARRILDEHFQPDALGARLDALYAQIATDLVDDPFPAARLTNPEDSGYESIVAAQKDFMRRRYDAAAAELAEP